MKRITVILLCVIIILCGCHGQTPDKITEYAVHCGESDLFPFFAVDASGALWKIENTSAKMIGENTVAGDNCSFVRYAGSKLVFACDINVKNGITLCNVMLEASGKTVNIGKDVRFDSLRVGATGEVLFIGSNDILYYYHEGILSEIECDIAQAEFIGNESFLMRGKSGSYVDGEFQYPIYSYSAGFRNYVIAAPEIISADAENGRAFIIRNRHTVQKRTSSAETAECCIYSDGEIIFEVPSVVLSQFEAQGSHKYLLACDESLLTLKYDLYCVDGNQPELVSSNVISGEYISSDRQVYRFETDINGHIVTNVANGEKILSFPAEKNISGIYSFENTLYKFSNGALSLSDGTPIIENIESVSVQNGGMFCISGTEPPYSIYLCSGSNASLLINDSATTDFTYADETVYYYTGEKGFYDFASAGASGNKTALMSNIDTHAGFVCAPGCVAAVRNENKALYIMSHSRITEIRIPVQRLISQDEVKV